MDFTTWLTSGWSEAWAQWQHPLTALQDSFNSSVGLPITPIPGSTEFGAAGYSAAGSLGDTDDTSDDSGLSWSTWGIIGAVLVGLLLILLLTKAVEDAI